MDHAKFEEEISKVSDLSETAFAEVLLKVYGPEIAYVEPFEWHFFSETHGWEPGKEKRLLPLIKEASEHLLKMAFNSNGAEREKLASFYAQLCSNRMQSGIKNLISGYAQHPRYKVISFYKEWDNNPNVLGTPDGTFNLISGKAAKHNPIHKVRHRTGGDPSNNNAGAFKRWESFLKEIMPDEKIREYVRWTMGRALYGATKDEAVYLITGPGGTGKSTFLGAIRNAMGTYAPVIPASALLQKGDKTGPNPELLKLFRARLAITIETRQGMQFNEATLKQLTGGDAITCRDLYKSPMTFSATHSLFLASNSIPKASVDDAIIRRFRVIPFDVKIKDSVAARKRKTWLMNDQEAACAVLWWLVQAAKEHRENVMPPNGVPASINIRTMKALSEGDPFMQFIIEQTSNINGEWTPFKDIYAAYEKFFSENHPPDDKPLSQRAIAMKLQGLGYPSDRRLHVNGYRNIILGTRCPDRTPQKQNPSLGSHIPLHQKDPSIGVSSPEKTPSELPKSSNSNENKPFNPFLKENRDEDDDYGEPQCEDVDPSNYDSYDYFE